MSSELRGRKLVIFDIDGTIASAGGPIEASDIKLLEAKGILWGILSSRSRRRAIEACEAIGVKPSFIGVCRVDMRSEELKDMVKRFQFDEYIYVADREIDRQEAKQAGWHFILASNFRRADV